MADRNNNQDGRDPRANQGRRRGSSAAENPFRPLAHHLYGNQPAPPAAQPAQPAPPRHASNTSAVRRAAPPPTRPAAPGPLEGPVHIHRDQVLTPRDNPPQGQASFRDRVAPFIQGPAASVGMANQRRERFGPGHIAAGAASATLAGPSRQAYAFTPDENAPGPNEPGPSQPLRRRPSRQRLRPRTSYEVVSGQGVHRVPRQRRESTSSDDDLYD